MARRRMQRFLHGPLLMPPTLGFLAAVPKHAPAANAASAAAAYCPPAPGLRWLLQLLPPPGSQRLGRWRPHAGYLCRCRAARRRGRHQQLDAQPAGNWEPAKTTQHQSRWHRRR
mmetsp:Transcript_83183/g.248210  ORF Transcript_83183/g.248210 Transcript_83183/m.248210 type:complete len:114 (+) Transcript_83183:1577-1918(+)